MRAMEKSSYAQINYFQDNIAHGKENQWRCRAGARYLYICEDGLVHYCSQQRGYPAKPLAEYTVADIRREYLTEKALRAALHRGLRASDFVHRFLARAADHQRGRHAAGGRPAGADPLTARLGPWASPRVAISRATTSRKGGKPVVRYSYQLRGNVLVVVAVDASNAGHVLPAIAGCLFFIASGRRRDASEMISRRRVTATVHMSFRKAS